MPAEKAALDVCNWMYPLVALAHGMSWERMSKSYQDKISPLPESDPDFRSH